MGGGCTCNSTIKKYFYGSADCELNPGNNSNDNSQNNKNKIPEKNIKIIPKEDDIDNIKSNNMQDSDKTKKQNDKNNNKIINNSPSINNENKKKISNNNLNNNSSLYLCSNHNSNKNISNNNVNHNHHVVSNTVIVNGNHNYNNSSNINYQNQTQNNSKHKAIQKKVEDEKVKKAETNYNYNLGEHNFIFINISQGSSAIKNDSEKYESTTPKMGMENFEDMGKANKRKFSHFYINKINQKPCKKTSNNNNKLVRADHSLCYMLNYSEEMLKAINSLRKNPESFIQYIDSMVNNNIQIKNDEIYIVSQNVDEKIKLMEDYLLIFEQIKRSLQDIINSNIVEDLEELKYNEELEIDIDYAKNLMNNNQSHVERSEISNSKYLSNTNNVKRKKKIDFNSTLDLSDDIIATLILHKRKELKKKYPENIFKMNIIKDVNINILIQMSMEIMYDNNNKMLNEIIFNPKYKNFAVSWANELNRNFISISCFA